MTLLLDPDRDGCRIYFIEKATVKYIRGNIQEICERIYRYCVHKYMKYGVEESIQMYEIILDEAGIGSGYVDGLTHFNLDFEVLSIEKDIQI